MPPSQPTRLDAHGQPLAPYNARAVQRRAVAELLGFVRGVLADNRVTDDEILALRRWMSSNPDALCSWPGNVLADRVLRVLQDGVVTEEEREDLTALLADATGTIVDDEITGPVATPTRLAYNDPPPTISFDGRRFVLTGRFYLGTRAVCERHVASRRGVCHPRVTRDVHFLVVGGIGSEQWAQQSYGTKIEEAVALREEGHPIAIVAEKDWASALN